MVGCRGLAAISGQSGVCEAEGERGRLPHKMHSRRGRRRPNKAASPQKHFAAWLWR
ncbi:hypothetical protein AN958_08052 [Leucoagaricus sp. SymC.cos]|nr:hypothetical protein AN958_08052 [Leucoagaricus sp. SymC.cos]